MIIKEITDTLEQFAPLKLQASYDNAGLLTGNHNDQVHSALIALDITEDVIDEAIAGNFDMIISHHPLLISGIKRFNGTDYVERCLIKAIKNSIAIYSSHTNIDSVKEGVSGRICDKLNIKERDILIPNEDGESGYGMVGELPKPIESLQFLKMIKEIFNCGAVRHSEITTDQIHKVAVCGGSGSSFLDNAIASKADIYITGDFKYHDFFRSEKSIIIADIGHYESEQYTKEIFYELVTKKFPTFAFQMSKIYTNPINYL